MPSPNSDKVARPLQSIHLIPIIVIQRTLVFHPLLGNDLSSISEGNMGTIASESLTSHFTRDGRRRNIMAAVGAVLLIAPLASSLTSCAGVQVKRVTAKSNEPGIRYWRPEPYFALVETKTDKSVTCDVKTFYLPDKSEEYAITISAGVGKANVTPQLQDGWNLTSLSADIDSKTSENITAISSLLKEAAGAGFFHKESQDAKAPASQPHCQGIYRVTYDSAGHFDRFVPVTGLKFY